MKKSLVLMLVLLAFCANSVFAQNSVGLDRGIEDAAHVLNERIPAGTSVAVFNFSSDSRKLSEYIIDELTIALTDLGMDVFDRNNLDEVNREIYYGFSGAVSDDTAQLYGQDIGVQTVILGSITKSDETTYRLRVQAIIVETKRIQAASTVNIKQDEKFLSLLLGSENQNIYRFTKSQKTQAGFKNMLFGLGSFQMKDTLGGVTVLAGETISAILLIIGVTASDYSESTSSDSYSYSESNGNPTLMIAGVVCLLGTWTWGFIRPYSFDKPLAVQKVANVIDHVNIGVIPANNGLTKVSFSLNYKF